MDDGDSSSPEADAEGADPPGQPTEKDARQVSVLRVTPAARHASSRYTSREEDGFAPGERVVVVR